MLPEPDRALLAAVAAGRVHRGGEGMFAPYELRGGDITTHLRRLARGDLVALPPHLPPRLTPSGECALRMSGG